MVAFPLIREIISAINREQGTTYGVELLVLNAVPYLSALVRQPRPKSAVAGVCSICSGNRRLPHTAFLGPCRSTFSRQLWGAGW